MKTEKNVGIIKFGEVSFCATRAEGWFDRYGRVVQDEHWECTSTSQGEPVDLIGAFSYAGRDDKPLGSLENSQVYQGYLIFGYTTQGNLACHILYLEDYSSNDQEVRGDYIETWAEGQKKDEYKMGYWVYWFKGKFPFKEKWISFFRSHIEEDIGGRVMWLDDVVEVAERYVRELHAGPPKLFERIFMLEGELTTPEGMVYIPGSGRGIRIDNPDYPLDKPKWGHFMVPKPEAVLAYLQSDRERPCRFDPSEPRPGEPFTVITSAPEYWLGGKTQRGTSIKFLAKVWGGSITVKDESE